MGYIGTIDELFDEQVQEQIRQYKKKRSSVAAWYRIQNAIEKARKFRMYHQKMAHYTLPNLFDENGDPVTVFYHHDPERRQVNMIKSNLLRSKQHKFKRGRVTPKKLRNILLDIEARRAQMYIEQENGNNMEKKKILCIVGQSGAGKTLASLHLQNYKDANVICSYTTRPPRKTEVEGREHHFIDIVPDKTELLAYTHFSSHYYYALKDQVFGPCTVYVIDEKGLENLKQDNGDEYEVYSVYIKRSWGLRRKCGVSISRIRRDEVREKFDENKYDYVIYNNGSKVEFFDEIERIYDEICKK